MTHHAKAATSVSITGDGRLVASCGLDKIATVVLISDAVLLSSAPAKTHVGFVSGVDASADGSVTVSSSHDGTARTAHGFTGEPMAACEGHGDLIFGSCVTRDGTHIITGARDRTVRIWDSKSGAQVALLEAHTNSVMAVCCDSTTTRLASGSSDQTAIVWKQVVGTGFNYTSTVCRGHSGNVMSVELSRDGKLLATGSSDATVRLWVAETGEELCSLDDHGRSIEAVVMDVKRETLLSAGADGSVRVWDISLVMKTGKAPCRAVFEGHTDAVTGMALTDDMSYVYTSCDDFTVRAWRVKDASLVAQMVLDEESTSIACCNDRVWVGTQSGRVCRFLLHLPVPVGAKESVAEARASSSGGLVVAKTMGSPSTKKRSKKTGGGDEKDKCLVM